MIQIESAAESTGGQTGSGAESTGGQTGSAAESTGSQIESAGSQLGGSFVIQIETEPVSGKDMSISDFLYGQNKPGEVPGATYELDAPEFIRAYAKTNKSVQLAWRQVPHAQGYIIYRKTGSGKWKKYKVISGNMNVTYTDKKLSSGTTYRYKICAYRIEGKKKVYSEASLVMKLKTAAPTVKGKYKKGTVYGPVSTKSELAQVRRVAQSFKDNYIKAGMTEAQKALAIFEYVRNTCDYTWENWTQRRAGSAWGALVEGKAHCGGYSRAVKVLCDAVGLKCYYVHANAKSHNPTHRWNLVRIDGTWYVLDSKDGVFLAGTDTFCKKLGMTWNVKHYPKCSKTNHEMFFQTTKEG